MRRGKHRKRKRCKVCAGLLPCPHQTRGATSFGPSSTLTCPGDGSVLPWPELPERVVGGIPIVRDPSMEPGEWRLESRSTAPQLPYKPRNARKAPDGLTPPQRALWEAYAELAITASLLVGRGAGDLEGWKRLLYDVRAYHVALEHDWWHVTDPESWPNALTFNGRYFTGHGDNTYPVGGG
jgi:hypothetical protein